MRRRGQAQIPGEGAGPGQLGPSAAVAAAASSTAPASPPPSPGSFPPAAAETQAKAGEDGGAGPRLCPCPRRWSIVGRHWLKGKPPARARGAHTRPPPPPSSPLSLPPLPSPLLPSAPQPPLRREEEPFPTSQESPDRFPSGEKEENTHSEQTGRSPRGYGSGSPLTREPARSATPPTLTQPLPHRQRSPAGPRPRRAHSQRGARAGDAWHRSGGGRGCCCYCHRCHGCWPGPGPGARVSAVGLSPQPRPPSLRPLLRRAPGLLRPRLRPRSWSQAGSPGPAPRPGPCTATEPRGALGLPSPNTQPRTPPAPRHRPMPTRTLEPRSLHCRCPGDQARLSEASRIPSLPDPRTPVWASLQAPGSCPAAPVHSTTGPCASPTTWRARNPGLVSDRESMGARAMGLGAGSCSRAL